MLACFGLLLISLTPPSVSIDTSKVLNQFIPETALGFGIDGHERGDLRRIYTLSNLREMKSTGLRSLTYRLRTELGIQAWHWNPEGTWSDARHRQGYWTSMAKPGKFVRTTYGYRLPRRGSTIDQANNDGYSRIDDGDPRSFWKSNPYLDQRFTHESNSKHPQWLVVDFNHRVSIDRARILWGTPYATRFRVEFWNGAPRVDERDPKSGHWQDFENGKQICRGGGRQDVFLGKTITAQYVRFWFGEGSLTAPKGSHDVRDRLGIALCELQLGYTDARGKFHDEVRHQRDKDQTEMVVSSTDPWHRATDIDRNVEQPGFDRLVSAGLTNGLPMMVPLPVLFGVPEDAANELLYLKARGYPVRSVEMGEEPDGQMTTPADYGAMYLQVANGIRKQFPNVVLGGPCFQTTQVEFRDWPEPNATPWLKGFLSYLREHHRERDLGFFSFEWYPFDNVSANPLPQLKVHKEIFARTLRRLEQQGLIHDLPWMITEYGYSAFAGPSELDIPGAILNAQIVGEFLRHGGNASFLYGYEPADIIRESGDSWGNLTTLLTDAEGKIILKAPTFWGARLIAFRWCSSPSGRHKLVATQVAGNENLDAYALARPDGSIGLLLLNRSERPIHGLKLKVDGTVQSKRVSCSTYGRDQYVWKNLGENSHATKAEPPLESRCDLAHGLELPALSITVLQFIPQAKVP